jgi:hypothetical protein
MADRIDILLDSDNDLRFNDGDFMSGTADLHHVEVILISAPGAFKQSPLSGANIRSLISGRLDVAARRDIKLQLASDGYKPKTLTIDNSGAMVVEI